MERIWLYLIVIQSVQILPHDMIRTSIMHYNAVANAYVFSIAIIYSTVITTIGIKSVPTISSLSFFQSQICLYWQLCTQREGFQWWVSFSFTIIAFIQHIMIRSNAKHCGMCVIVFGVIGIYCYAVSLKCFQHKHECDYSVSPGHLQWTFWPVDSFCQPVNHPVLPSGHCADG